MCAFMTGVCCIRMFHPGKLDFLVMVFGYQ